MIFSTEDIAGSLIVIDSVEIKVVTQSFTILDVQYFDSVHPYAQKPLTKRQMEHDPSIIKRIHFNMSNGEILACSFDYATCDAYYFSLRIPRTKFNKYSSTEEIEHFTRIEEKKYRNVFEALDPYTILDVFIALKNKQLLSIQKRYPTFFVPE
jgi:hypothetical protein